MSDGWQPSLGAWQEGNGVQFRVWAQQAQCVELLLESSDNKLRDFPMRKSENGFFSIRREDVPPGAGYRYRVDGKGPFPDPAARFQPRGIHGPSTFSPSTFPWTDRDWMNARVPRDLVLYELHVGTFSPEGTFRGVEDKLPGLKQLGVSAIELMPLGDFPGRRNWGYDGVSLFAPARCYGTPDDLRHLVNTAHGLGLAVFLDVVYNHLGPDGNYTGAYSPWYVSKNHRTPWGDALNFDGPHSQPVREFFIENALYWIHEFHIDGLRLDATHAILDDSPRHFLAELAERLHQSAPDRGIVIIAEDHGNLAHMISPIERGGWGLEGVWADDFHHQMRRLLAGDSEGYYSDYTGTVDDLARTINQGWFYCGQHSRHWNKPRGSDPAGLSPDQFVVCLQNHDQVGNRAFGERLHHQIDLAAYRAASALLLCLPQTPLLFMGQEWACSSPFRFFTDHTPELGRLVTEGRRREFKHFTAFADPATRERIPDPQDQATFESSQLDWPERERWPHCGIEALYRRLLQLRRAETALNRREAGSFAARAVGDSALILERRGAEGERLLVVCQLRGSGEVPIGGRTTEIILTTEESAFCQDSQAPVFRETSLVFQRPGTVLLRW
jgi:maltooligosyltrehalose trehalohydrolase